jgi:LysM repeat protein
MKHILAAVLLPAMLAACGGSGGGASASAAAKPSASVASVAVATVAPAPTPAATPTVDAVVYTVKPGDTLSSIATQNKTSIDALSKANNLTDPDKLQVGQKLTIPASAASPAGPSASGSAAGLPPAASKPPPP